MENTTEICKTDAEILLCFMALKDSGFAFKYAKRENGIFQQYVNCNGKVYGPYDYIAYISNFDGIAEWTGQKGDIEFKYTNNGKDCKTEKIKEITQKEIDLLLSGISLDNFGRLKEEYNEVTHVLSLNRKHQVLSPFAIKTIIVLDNGDVAYSKIQADTETWFYNDKQISVPVKGYNSTIYDSIITYKRDDRERDVDGIPYFMLNGKEYNGMASYAYKGGFVYLAEGAIQFFPWKVQNILDFIAHETNEKYDRYCNEMFQGLYYSKQLAGRD